MSPGTSSSEGTENTPDENWGDLLPGDGIALLRVPDFGADYEVPIMVGVDERKVLSRGIGWYDYSSQPGQISNFAIAAHRGPGGPFDALTTLTMTTCTRRYHSPDRSIAFGELVKAVEKNPSDPPQ